MFILYGSVDNLPGSVEGSGYKQVTLKLENKAFQLDPHNIIPLKHHKEPYVTTRETLKWGM